MLISVSCGSGCWDSSDLNTKSTPIVGAYDLSAQSDKEQYGNKVDLIAIMPLFDREAKNKYFVDFTSGTDVIDNRNKKQYHLSNSYQTGTGQCLLFGVELARSKDFIGALEVSLRNPNFGKDKKIGVAEPTSKEVLSIKNDNYSNPATYIIDLLNNINSKVFQVNMTMHQFSYSMNNPGLNGVLPIIKNMGDGKLAIYGTAIFRKDIMIARADVPESEILTFLRGWKCRGAITQSIYEQEKLIDEASITASNEREVKFKKIGDEYYFDVTISLKGNLAGHKNKENKVDKKFITLVEKNIQDDIERRCQEFIDKMQNEWKVDCIDLTKYPLAKDRQKLIKKNFSDIVQNQFHINVKVKVKISGYGEIL
jgi:Ger(x)C family germination protein